MDLPLSELDHLRRANPGAYESLSGLIANGHALGRVPLDYNAMPPSSNVEDRRGEIFDPNVVHLVPALQDLFASLMDYFPHASTRESKWVDDFAYRMQDQQKIAPVLDALKMRNEMFDAQQRGDTGPENPKLPPGLLGEYQRTQPARFPWGDVGGLLATTGGR